MPLQTLHAESLKRVCALFFSLPFFSAFGATFYEHHVTCFYIFNSVCWRVSVKVVTLPLFIVINCETLLRMFLQFCLFEQLQKRPHSNVTSAIVEITDL